MIDENTMKAEKTNNSSDKTKTEINLKMQYNPELNDIKDFQYEKNFIKNKLNQLEIEFLSKYDDDFIKNKNQSIKEFIREIQSKIFITESDYKKLKEFALDKAGFLTNENRQSIYRKIFFHEFDNKRINLFNLDLNKTDFINLNEFEEIKQLSNLNL